MIKKAAKPLWGERQLVLKASVQLTFRRIIPHLIHTKYETSLAWHSVS